MLNRITVLKNLLSPAPEIERIKDKDKVDKLYRYWRIRTFYAMYFGYVLFYFTRKSFNFATPALIADLGFTAKEIGFLSTVIYVSYGISKFISGVASDKSNPRYFMSLGLMLTGVISILFGCVSSLWALAFFWGLNGWFQGWGWPPCSKQLTHWYGQKERGKWWSACGTSHNLGGAIIPVLAGYIAQYYGWRQAMFIPGLICILGSFFVLNRMRDIPATLGLPSIEEYCNESTDNDTSVKLSAKDILYQQVMSNKYIWILGLSYFFVYIIRHAINDWALLFLVQNKDYTTVEAGFGILWFEVGGFLGILAAGWGSDHFFKGQRVPYMLVCTILLIIVLPLVWYIPVANHLLDFGILGIIGFLIFGPQMLVGLAASEFVNKQAAGTANGFASCFAYLGAAVTGYPLGLIIEEFGWNYFFVILALCAVATSVVLWPVLNAAKKNKKNFVSKNSKLKQAGV